MAYEAHQPYLKAFDREQAPNWLQALAQRAGVTMTAHRYLDLGCAAGHSTLALAPMYPDTQFVGVDFNAAHVAMAQAEAKRLGLHNCTYVQADFRDMPKSVGAADVLMVRGIYSWLSPEVKSALEALLDSQATPTALLRLHYTVLPGGVVRDALGKVIQASGGATLGVEGGQALVELMTQHAPAFHRHLVTAADTLANTLKQPRELWVHDLLNDDYRAEYASDVFDRLARQGYAFAAATSVERNMPMLLVDPPVVGKLHSWHTGATQTMLDVFTFNDGRSDMFVRGQEANWQAGQYDKTTRWGLVLPEADWFKPVTIPRGSLRFEHPNVVGLIQSLRDEPQTFGAIQAKHPSLTGVALRDWIDLLWAGGKVAPFLSTKHASSIDRERMRCINRERIAWANADLSPNSRVPLLAAEYGNCLVAGWFECLVLAHYEKRHHVGTQRNMLSRMHKAGMAFKGADGKPHTDQLKAFQAALTQLDNNYLTRMDYWGIDI